MEWCESLPRSGMRGSPKDSSERRENVAAATTTRGTWVSYVFIVERHSSPSELVVTSVVLGEWRWVRESLQRERQEGAEGWERESVTGEKGDRESWGPICGSHVAHKPNTTCVSNENLPKYPRRFKLRRIFVIIPNYIPHVFPSLGHTIKEFKYSEIGVLEKFKEVKIWKWVARASLRIFDQTSMKAPICGSEISPPWNLTKLYLQNKLNT